MGRTTVSAPVVRVELFEDRASITRRLALPAEPGRHALRLADLTPLVREAGLQFLGAPGVVVEEARVTRERFTPEAADTAAEKALWARHRALQDALIAQEAAVRRADERAARAETLAERAGEWAPWALLGESDGKGWVEAYRGLAASAADLRREHALADLDLARQRDEAAALAHRLDEARNARTRVRANLDLQVVLPAGATLDVRYTVPCALWRPVHRATLDGARVAWEVGAMAWNATGEDWDGVTLVCSTARPSTRAEPPVLVDDEIGVQPRAKEVVVASREEEIQVAREGQARRADEVPGVDDGGEPRTFTAPETVTIPSNGRPVQVVLERWAAEAKVAWVAHPELSPDVVLRSVQPNGGTRPLLAGPVDLFRESGAVGRGQVKLVAPGEPFAMGWGAHDEVRVARRRDLTTDTTRILGRKVSKFEITTRVAHTGREPLRVTVRERLPVSELKELGVGAPEAKPALTAPPDRDGLCAWELVLEPGTTRELSLTYTVEASSNVTLPW